MLTMVSMVNLDHLARGHGLNKALPMGPFLWGPLTPSMRCEVHSRLPGRGVGPAHPGTSPQNRNRGGVGRTRERVGEGVSV
jgi:hypothetical protein